MTTIKNDDPRITQYSLNEMSESEISICNISISWLGGNPIIAQGAPSEPDDLPF